MFIVNGRMGKNVWGLASVSFARGRHLTRSRHLAGAAAPKPRGQVRFTHSAGQADIFVLPPQSKPRGCHTTLKITHCGFTSLLYFSMCWTTYPHTCSICVAAHMMFLPPTHAVFFALSYFCNNVVFDAVLG